jgi:hypothetical protein
MEHWYWDFPGDELGDEMGSGKLGGEEICASVVKAPNGGRSFEVCSKEQF